MRFVTVNADLMKLSSSGDCQIFSFEKHASSFAHLRAAGGESRARSLRGAGAARGGNARPSARRTLGGAKRRVGFCCVVLGSFADSTRDIEFLQTWPQNCVR
eukprot:6185504-Pleurochrysis_carterae.AAC.3